MTPTSAIGQRQETKIIKCQQIDTRNYHTERSAAIQSACPLIPELARIAADYAEDPCIYIFNHNQRFNLLTELWEPSPFTPTQLRITTMVTVGDRIYAQLDAGNADYKLGYWQLTRLPSGWQRGQSEWVTIPAPKSTSMPMCFAALHNKLYAIGASDKQVLYSFDEKTHQWDELAPTNHWMYGGRAITMDNTIYRIGHTRHQCAMEVYDKTTNTWTEAPSLPENTYNVQLFYHAGVIHAIGYKEKCLLRGTYMGFYYIFSSGAAEWTPVPHMIQIMPRWSDIRTCAVFNDQLYMFGVEITRTNIFIEACKIKLNTQSSPRDHCQSIPLLNQELRRLYPEVKFIVF